MRRALNRPNPTPARPTASLRILTLILAATAVLATGCGSGGESGSGDTSAILARVGDTAIRADYYEDRLARLERDELPRGENGEVLDMAGLEGKEKFLGSLITKEVMYQVAQQKFASDPQIVGARESLSGYEGEQVMWAHELKADVPDPSEETLRAHYAKMKHARTCQYVITDYVDQAREARAAALGGMDWLEVASRFHAGDPDPNGEYALSVPFGRYSEEFDGAIFATPIGGVSEPIKTEFGYWVVKVLEEKDVELPPFEDLRERIVNTFRARAKGQAQEDFKARAQEHYDYVLDEEALAIVFAGLPVGEEVFYPGTQDPVRREDLLPLDVPAAAADRLFYAYDQPGEGRHEVTVGQYKARFDDMSVFARPKRAQMLGGLRSAINTDVNKDLLRFETVRLGYDKHPDTVNAVRKKLEELLVNKLYTSVMPQGELSDAQRDSFWSEVGGQYALPETRDGRLVVCADEASALAARDEARAGTSWREILVARGTDADNKSRGVRFTGIRADGRGALRDALFGMEIGAVSDPFPTEDGRFAVVALDAVHPPRQPELSEVRDNVDQRLGNILAERAFQAALAEWQTQVAIEKFPENLGPLKSWDELHVAVSAPTH